MHIFKNTRTKIIAIVGPDGVGKSTLISYCQSILKKKQINVIVRHWRPGLLPNLGAYVGKKEPNSGPITPRRNKGNLNILRLFYYGIDFWMGFFLKDVSFKSKKESKLILYDRHAIDMSVDPIRYGLSSDKYTLFFAKNIPEPDYIIVLYDDVNNIYNRKKELQPSEIYDQLEKWKLHLQNGMINRVLYLTGNKINDGKELAEIIYQFLIK